MTWLSQQLRYAGPVMLDGSLPSLELGRANQVPEYAISDIS